MSGPPHLRAPRPRPGLFAARLFFFDGRSSLKAGSAFMPLPEGSGPVENMGFVSRYWREVHRVPRECDTCDR